MDIMLAKTTRPAIITIAIIVIMVTIQAAQMIKYHTNEYCDGYSLGYTSKWNSLAGGTSTQQSQCQAQGGSNVRVDGSHNNIIIAPRQTQKQSSNSESNSENADYGK